MRPIVLLILHVLVTHVAFAENQSLIHESEFPVKLDLNHVHCMYQPGGGFMQEGVYFRVDAKALDMGPISRNDQLGVYGFSARRNIMEDGQDCDVVAQLWTLSDNGIIALTGKKRVKEGSDMIYKTDFYCSQGYTSEITVELPVVHMVIKETRRMQIQKVGGVSLDCTEVLPIATKGKMLFHPRAASHYGMTCERVEWPDDYKISMSPRFSNVAWPEKMESTQIFSHVDCLLKVEDLMAKAKKDDPKNDGQVFDVDRFFQMTTRETNIWDPILLSQKVRYKTAQQKVTFPFYDIDMEGEIFFDIQVISVK